MKKVLVVLLVALVAVFSVNAMGPEFGIKGGLTFANAVVGDEGGFIGEETDENPLKIGITAGLMMEMPMGPLSIGAEVLYTQKGEKYAWGDDTVTVALDYIEVPVMAKLSLLPMIKFYGGVSFGFLTTAKVKFDIEGFDLEDQDIKEHLNSTEMGAIFGAQVKISKLVLDARYNHGLTDIVKDNEGDAVNLRTLSATVGFMF